MRKDVEDREAASIRTTDPKLTQEMCAKIKKGNLSEYEKNQAVLHLMNKGDSSCVLLFIKLLKNNDTSPYIRETVIRALGKIGDKRAVPVLLEILEQPIEGDIKDNAEVEAIIRRKVIDALGSIGDPSVLSVLRDVEKSDNDYESAKSYAGRAVKKIEANGGAQ